MSCRLSEMNWLDATYRLVRKYPGGVEALAERMQISASTLYNKLRRQIPTHHLSVEELNEILDSAAEANIAECYEPLRALTWRHQHIAVPLPAHKDATHDELAQLICSIVIEQGEVAARIQHALRNDSAIDSRELDGIDHEVEKAMSALAALREKVQAMHLAAKQQGLVR